MTLLLDAAPGDILAVWTGAHDVENAIRAGEAFHGLPAVANHVAVVTHQDKLGRWMGVWGQPGGVVAGEVTHYLTDSRTRSNHGQPRANDHQQLPTFLASCAKSIGLSYDWVGIGEDVLTDLHLANVAKLIDHLWRWPTTPGDLPAHVVCSSLAAILYEIVGWAHPEIGHERQCQPADWWDWNDRQLWTPGKG